MPRLALLCAIATTLASTAAAQQGSLSVGSATASAGTTVYGAISVPAGSDSALEMPIAVIRGAKPGPVVAFVAGAHGTEYTSIIAMQRLISRVDAKSLSGTVIVAPLLNVPSFLKMTPHVNPIDGKGMNAGYPGDANGTQTARALALVQQQIVTPADVIVDLHGGDLDEDLRPYSYWFRGGRPAQDSAGLKLVMAFGLDHIIVNDIDASSNPGRSLSSQALVKGKTVLVAEAGRSGVVTPADVNALVNGSLNVLGELKMISRAVVPVKNPVWLSGASPRIIAKQPGVFSAAVARDTRVKKGQVLGHMTDFLGRPIGDVRSEIDGLVTFIRGVPSMWTGATLATVLPVLAKPEPWKAPNG
jgi:predicted deacylase